MVGNGVMVYAFMLWWHVMLLCHYARELCICEAHAIMSRLKFYIIYAYVIMPLCHYYVMLLLSARAFIVYKVMPAMPLPLLLFLYICFAAVFPGSSMKGVVKRCVAVSQKSAPFRGRQLNHPPHKMGSEQSKKRREMFSI